MTTYTNHNGNGSRPRLSDSYAAEARAYIHRYEPTVKREPVARPAPVTELAQALAAVDTALAQMGSSDPKMAQFRRVVQAVWAQVAPDEINLAAKGA